MKIPLTLHFTGSSSDQTKVAVQSLIKAITYPSLASVSGQNGITTVDNLTGDIPQVGDSIIFSITPTTLSTASMTGGTSVLSVTNGTTASTKKITFASTAPATLTTASALQAGAQWWPAVTRLNGSFVFKTTDTTINADSLVTIVYTEVGTNIVRSAYDLNVNSISSLSGVTTVTTEPWLVGSQNSTEYNITSFSYTSGKLATTQDTTFFYNIPKWIADIPCKVVLSNVYHTSAAVWMMSIQGVTQQFTTELTSTKGTDILSTQEDMATRLGVLQTNYNYEPFYGILRSGTNTLTVILEKVVDSANAETSMSYYFTLTFTPLE